MGQEHFAENPENAAQEHAYSDDYGGFIHEIVNSYWSIVIRIVILSGGRSPKSKDQVLYLLKK
jgi:hypothetical protein